MVDAVALFDYDCLRTITKSKKLLFISRARRPFPPFDAFFSPLALASASIRTESWTLEKRIFMV